MVELARNTAVNTPGAVNREDGNVITRKATVPNFGSNVQVSNAGNDRASVAVSCPGIIAGGNNNNDDVVCIVF